MRHEGTNLTSTYNKSAHFPPRRTKVIFTLSGIIYLFANWRGIFSGYSFFQCFYNWFLSGLYLYLR